MEFNRDSVTIKCLILRKQIINKDFRAQISHCYVCCFPITFIHTNDSFEVLAFLQTFF